MKKSSKSKKNNKFLKGSKKFKNATKPRKEEPPSKFVFVDTYISGTSANPASSRRTITS